MEEVIHVQVKDNSPSIERILRPITYTSWLLGVGIAHPRKYPKAITLIIRIIYMTIYSIGILYNVKKYFYYIRKYGFNIVNSIQYLHILMAYVSAYYYVYHGIRQYNKWPELMDRLKELDQKIKKEISMNDQSIKIVEALAVFATICCFSIPVLFYFYLINWSFLPLKDLFSLMLSNVMLAQSSFNSFVFDIVVYVLYCRFQTLNKLIGQLNKLSDVLAFKIRRIRELHTDICDLVTMVNDIHSLHLLFFSTYCFITAVYTLFHFYTFFTLGMTEIFFLRGIFHCIIVVTQFYLICWICTLVRQESNRTGRILYEIILKCEPVCANLDKQKASNLSSLEVRPPLEDLNDEQSFNRSSSHNLSDVDMENLLRRNLDRECVTKEINFSIQLQQYRIAFTACNFFEINNGLFSGFVGLIITYLIIISQHFLQSANDFREKFDENFRELKTDILEMKKEILEMFSKENQTDLQN